MYASCYLLTKVEDLEPLTPTASPSRISGRQGSMELEKLEIWRLDIIKCHSTAARLLHSNGDRIFFHLRKARSVCLWCGIGCKKNLRSSTIARHIFVFTSRWTIVWSSRCQRKLLQNICDIDSRLASIQEPCSDDYCYRVGTAVRAHVSKLSYWPSSISQTTQEAYEKGYSKQ